MSNRISFVNHVRLSLFKKKEKKSTVAYSTGTRDQERIVMLHNRKRKFYYRKRKETQKWTAWSLTISLKSLDSWKKTIGSDKLPRMVGANKKFCGSHKLLLLFIKSFLTARFSTSFALPKPLRISSNILIYPKFFGFKKTKGIKKAHIILWKDNY